MSRKEISRHSAQFSRAAFNPTADKFSASSEDYVWADERVLELDDSKSRKQNKNAVGTRFTTGLRSQIFRFKSNLLQTSNV